MSAESADLEASIADALAESGMNNPSVTISGSSSVGATRQTLFIDITADGARTPAVAQIGPLTDSRTGGANEAALLTLAGAAGVPVPEVVAVTDRLGDEAADVLITTRVDGLSVPRQILRSLPDEAAGEQLAHECGAAMARIHSINVDALPAAVDRLDPSDPFGSYCDWLEKDLNELPTKHPAIRWGINWLRGNPPSSPAGLALVHADFRNGNILVEDGSLTAVVDWEFAHAGDPMEDLAWICVRMWRFGNDDKPCGGFGSLDALRRGYESEGGTWREGAFHWWLAARSAWWAHGLALQGARFKSGESTSIVHAASGRRVPELEYDLLTQIREMEHSEHGL